MLHYEPDRPVRCATQLANTSAGSTAATDPSRPPLTAGSTVRNAEDSTAPAEPVAQLESAIVPPDFKRQKVPLEKGFSQMDWMRLQSKGKDLQGQPMNGVLPPFCLSLGPLSGHTSPMHPTHQGAKNAHTAVHCGRL